MGYFAATIFAQIVRGGMSQLFASHPPLEERIRRLEMGEAR